MKDGYIGLIVYSPRDVSVPVITRCNLQVSESLEVKGTYRSLTCARVNISNLDIHPESKTGITAAKVEIASFINSETEYLSENINLPFRWSVIDTVTFGGEVFGQDNTLDFLVKNIPAHPQGYFHKFRFQFLNKDLQPARIIYNTVTNDFISGSITGNKFTAAESPSWIENDLAGFSVQFFDQNEQPVYSSAVPIYKNSANEIYTLSNIPRINQSEIASIKIEESNYFFSSGPIGTGEEFNGIDDFSEIAEVLDLEAEVYLEDPDAVESSESWQSGDNYSYYYAKSNGIRMRFKNMYNHPLVNDVLHADGIRRNVNQAKWRSGNYYVIFVYASDTDAPPVNEYPVTDDQDEGEWIRVTELPVMRSAFPDTIYTTINNLPRNKFYTLFVGMMTDLTPTATNNKSLMVAD